jgi:hypothetical protein
MVSIQKLKERKFNMENYFNECLEYQESIKVGLISDYKSDWPDAASDEPAEQPSTTTEEIPSVPEVSDDPEDIEDPEMQDDVED